MAYNIESVTYMFQYIIHDLGYISIVIIGQYQSKNALTLIERIDKVDEIFKELGIEIEYRSLFRHMMIVGSFWLLNAVIIFALFTKMLIHHSALYTTTLLIFIYCYITNAQSIILYDYNTAVYWLGSRFKNINQLMKTSILKNSQVETEDSDTETIFEPSHNFRNRFESDNWLPERTVKVLQVNSTNNTRKLKQRSLSDDKIRLLQQIRFVHLQVCNVSKMVNQIFNAQILIYTTVILLNCSISVYFLYMQFSRPLNRIHSIELLIMYELSCVFAALKIPLMSYDCENTMRQANKTIGLLHACPVDEGNAELIDEILQFSWQISYTQLEKTKSVHYILNYGSVRYCLNFVISYLVMMIQWSQYLIKNDPMIITNKTTTFQTLQENTSIVV
ncbi:uncharacterized protein LOC122571204 [Bombus pyrosoma]|uniref:uncharacterized protein LOC122571204 n=1 Tax=Bombus pyrosoma TaxID=396416 RepID=UPI001CB9308B|nr:uncharacterized protein LOC122571204 [Bombus pyrosoma]